MIDNSIKPGRVNGVLRITLEAARINVGFSQKGVAKTLGISNKTLCSWEKGYTFPSTKQVDALCKLYNVNYDDIIFLQPNSL
jgi:DNA-binding XRE family transcriptional regulator